MNTFAFDLDDTLLGRDKRMGPDTRAELLARHAAGDRIIFATSRPYRAVRRYLDREIMDTGTLITQNGSVIYRDGKVLEYTLLDGFISSLIERLRKDPAIRISLEIRGLEFGCNAEYTDEELMELQSATRDMMLPLDEVDPYDITKIGIFGLQGDITYLLPDIKAAGCYGIPCEDNRFINVVHPSVDKSHALRKIIADGPADGRVFVFGDDIPDRRMMQLEGVHSVAMGNAKDEIKEVAAEVIGDCDTDCIGAYLRGVPAR